jgi:hypothetical protein
MIVRSECRYPLPTTHYPLLWELSFFEYDTRASPAKNLFFLGQAFRGTKAASHGQHHVYLMSEESDVFDFGMGFLEGDDPESIYYKKLGGGKLMIGVNLGRLRG